MGGWETVYLAPLYVTHAGLIEGEVVIVGGWETVYFTAKQ